MCYDIVLYYLIYDDIMCAGRRGGSALPGARGCRAASGAGGALAGAADAGGGGGGGRQTELGGLRRALDS